MNYYNLIKGNWIVTMARYKDNKEREIGKRHRFEGEFVEKMHQFLKKGQEDKV